ncbi:MAG: Zn-ribbon domain-containing OB-fold protein [Candidatus Aenigmatarchaeota archaeon]
MTHRSSISIFWRLKDSRYKLIGSKCKNCSIIHFPPRNICPECNNETEKHGLSGFGKVFSFTRIYTSPSGFEKQTPYTIGIIKLDEGPLITGEIIGNNVKIDKKVRVIFRKLYDNAPDGLIQYGFKFEIIE